jgi:hypothetical protein
MDAKPDRYRLGYSLFGGSGDDSQGAAEFNVSQFGVYIQDNFKITNNFKFSYGLRVDVPVWDKGTVNNDFNTRTIPLLNAAGKIFKVQWENSYYSSLLSSCWI